MWGTMGNAAFRRIEREAERINARTRRKRRVRDGGPRGPQLKARGRARRPAASRVRALLHAVFYLAVALGLLIVAMRYTG